VKIKLAFKLATVCSAVLCVGPALAQAVSSESQDKWQFTGAIYLWGADLRGQTISGSDVEVDFSDLLDNLEMAFFGAFAARKNAWSILADVVYMDVSAANTTDLSIPIGPIQVPVTTAAELDLEGWVFHMTGGYELHLNNNSRVDLIGGVRYLDLDMDLFLELQSLGPGQSRTVSESLTAWDGIIGLKGRAALGERWFLPYYIDIGAGESKLTWQASAGVGFQAGEIWDVALVYRHLEWDLDSTRVIDDINFSGPTLGVIFRW
jgi:opacity protein-like surface antigen